MKENANLLPTIEQNKAYHYAHEWFNKALFDGKLSRPMLLFTRNAKVLGGYFSPDRWKNEDGVLAHEIAINVNVFIAGDVISAFTTLIHEMTHQWQQEFGKPSRSGYHNKEWATKVVELGLEPKSENGGGTGQKVSTKLIDGGASEKAIASMPDKYVFAWYTTPDAMPDDDDGDSGQAQKPAPKSGKKQKYLCPICGDACWGKDSLRISCMKCNTQMIMRITNE